MHPAYLNNIKSFEGFSPRAQWDYAQHTNGFGTRALFPGETISRQEAELRFDAEIADARAIVEKHAKGWDEGTKAALTSLTFNCGTRWISSGLGDAVRAHDMQGLKERFTEYNKAQGQVLPGLVTRRLAESEWIGKDVQSLPAAGRSNAAMIAPAAMAAAPPAQLALTTLDALQVADHPAHRTFSSSTSYAMQVPEDALASTRLSWSTLISLLFDMQIRITEPTSSKQAEHLADRGGRAHTMRT
jgi:lysozyme